MENIRKLTKEQKERLRKNAAILAKKVKDKGWKPLSEWEINENIKQIISMKQE